MGHPIRSEVNHPIRMEVSLTVERLHTAHVKTWGPYRSKVLDPVVLVRVLWVRHSMFL